MKLRITISNYHSWYFCQIRYHYKSCNCLYKLYSSWKFAWVVEIRYWYLSAKNKTINNIGCMVYYTPFSFGYMRKWWEIWLLSGSIFVLGEEVMVYHNHWLVDTVTFYFINLLGFFLLFPSIFTIILMYRKAPLRARVIIISIVVENVQK